ncbi:unnamed protein product [Arabis nemorensis]|uniref:Uncharacterized protein n=1 Tax=Arabis nemorensis TaxID=586526 RepID=A0A565ASR0_9BRAS|nr:unnamed protein product [Arabis nemorensis]
MTIFLNDDQQHREAESPRFACLPASRESTYFPMVMGLNVWLGVASRIRLQFSSISYTWYWEQYGKFYITLRPDYNNLVEMIGEDDNYQLIFINIPSSVNNEAAVNLRLEARLDFPEELKVQAENNIIGRSLYPIAVVLIITILHLLLHRRK